MDDLKVLTIKRHSYGGRVRQQGDEYYVDHEKHLKFLIAIKKVVPAPATPVKKPVPKRAAPKRPAKRRILAQKSTYERKDIEKAPKNKAGARVKDENNETD